jgi:hypothetical protein
MRGVDSSSDDGRAGVLGRNGSASSLTSILPGQRYSFFQGSGVWGDSAKHVGVHGTADSNDGVVGESRSAAGGAFYSTSGLGLYVVSEGSDGIESRTLAGSPSAKKSAIYGNYMGCGGCGWAGYFGGDVNVTGTLSKGAGSFKIDDPLDPAHKYLQHSFVESPDMMNVYNGNVTTDAHGFATVKLPRYFQALNRTFRYQLTVMGHSFAQAIVWKEIAQNRFTIRTNQGRVRVSWQVTGVRHDVFANAHRIPTESAKLGRENGRYLHPELFGQSAAKGIGRLFGR